MSKNDVIILIMSAITVISIVEHYLIFCWWDNPFRIIAYGIYLISVIMFILKRRKKRNARAP